VHSEHDTKLLDTLWCQSARGHGDTVLFQVLDESLDLINVFRKLGIVCIVSLLDLLFFELEWEQTRQLKPNIPYVRSYTVSGPLTRGGSPPQMKASVNPSGLQIE
jgi:hypothetical protein